MFAKIFSQIFDSTLAEDYATRHIFIDLLVLADKTGVVDMTPEAIARRTNVPLSDIVSALTQFQQPDPRSRSHTEDGRRIVPLDPTRGWGWQIVNFEAYHKIRDENDRREKNRVYQREHRRREKEKAEDVSSRQRSSAPSAHIDIDIDLDRDKEKEGGEKPPPYRQRILSLWFGDRWNKLTEAQVAGMEPALAQCRTAKVPPEFIIDQAKRPGGGAPWEELDRIRKAWLALQPDERAKWKAVKL